MQSKFYGMDIFELEGKLERIPESSYTQILSLIIAAVNDHPKMNLADTDEFFNEIKALLASPSIELGGLISLSEKISVSSDAWLAESLNSLIEAFELMKKHEISFSDVLDEINRIEKL